MKVGIFGGSFNPPHIAHKKIAEILLKGKFLDKIVYVPTGNKYTKPLLIPAEHRYNMLKLFIENNKHLEVSDFEIKKSLVYTYETLDYFQKKYKNDEIYFILGTDNLRQINTWKNADYLLRNYKFLVIKRNDDNIDKMLSSLGKYQENVIPFDFSQDVSSTAIRNLIRNDMDVSNFIDKKVLEYIKAYNLYENE